MKKINLKPLLLALIYLSLFLSATPSHADLFNLGNAKKILDGAKKALEKTIEEAGKNKPQAPNNSIDTNNNNTPLAQILTTSDSMIEISDVIPTNTQWVMFAIEKNGITEQQIYKLTGPRFSKRISLRNGLGTYKIQIFTTSSIDRYKGEYNYASERLVQNTDSRNARYLLPTEMVQSEDPNIALLVSEITRDARNDSEAFRSIHQWIVTNIKYDYASYNDGTWVNNPFDALYVLNKKLTVCSGYSNLLAAMARAYGIQAKVINGKVLIDNSWGEHAWNEVLIEGEWKIVDSTWNVEHADKYYFIDAETFKEDHRKEVEVKAF